MQNEKILTSTSTVLKNSELTFVVTDYTVVTIGYLFGFFFKSRFKLHAGTCKANFKRR